MTEHKTAPTPGPWIVNSRAIEQDDAHRPISVVAYLEDENNDDWAANARLIAAAPEMLATLVLVRSAIRVHHEAGRNAVIEPWSVVTDALDKAIRIASGGAL